MKADIKTKWLEALRGDQYKQTTGRLRRDADVAGGARYCCLGVLSDLCKEEVGGKWEYMEYEGSWYFRDAEGARCALTKRILSFTELNESSQSTLIQMNDSGYSFSTIADYIEENL